jgi:hypothetical protein
MLRVVDAKKTTRMTRNSNAATECMTAATQPDPGSVISYSVFGSCCTGATTVGTIDTGSQCRLEPACASPKLTRMETGTLASQS